MARCQLGGGWLARVEADERLQRQERSPFVRAERGVGLGLVGAGVLLSPLVPAVAAPALLAGTALLVWSFVRVKLKTLKDDPYRNVDR